MFFKKEPSLLERAENRAIRELVNHRIGSEEYNETLDAVSRLHRMKVEEMPKSVSRDTLLIVGGNLLGILLIINHEYAHPVTSKALGLLLRPRT